MKLIIQNHPLWARFWAKVDRSGDCWLWTASTNGKGGYGKFAVAHGGPYLLAHRMSFQYAFGPLHGELEVDHTCRVRLCVNPAHLEAVTHEENMYRMRTKLCRRGHDNWYIPPCGKKRKCRDCANEARRARRV